MMDCRTWFRCFVVSLLASADFIPKLFATSTSIRLEQCCLLSLIMLPLRTRQMSASDLWLKNLVAVITSAVSRWGRVSRPHK